MPVVHNCRRTSVNVTVYGWGLYFLLEVDIALMTYDCIHGQSLVYFRNICSPIVIVPFRSRLRCADKIWLYLVLGPRVMVCAVSASRQPRFGTCYYLISRTVVLVANSSSRALRLGSLCKPTHKRRLWEPCLSGALQILDLIDWLIVACYCDNSHMMVTWLGVSVHTPAILTNCTRKCYL